MKRFLLTMSLSCFLPAIIGMPSQANSLDNLDTSPKQSKLVAQASPGTPGSTTVDPSAAPAGDKADPDKEKDKVDPSVPAGDKATPDKLAPDKAMPGTPDATTPPTPLTPPSGSPDMPAGDKATPDKPAPGAPGIAPSDAPVPPPGADPSISPAPGSEPAPIKPAGDGVRRFMRSSTQGTPNAAAQAELEKVKAESAAFLESVKNPNASQLDQSAGGTSYPSPTW